MSKTIKILLGIGLVLIAIQFIRPAHNINSQVSATDISKTVKTSDSVRAVLKKACYDCHSNNTYYPWYSNIQPVGWLLANHISQGKRQLNFSEFGSYSQRRQSSKLDDIANELQNDGMPLSSYKLLHKEARLTANEKILVIKWAQQK
jgi:hypothetical protein